MMANYNMPIGKTVLSLKACPTLSVMPRSFLVPRKVRFPAMTMFEQARHCPFGLTKTFELYACARGNNGQNEKKPPLSKDERLSNKKGRPASKEGTTAQASGSGTQG